MAIGIMLKVLKNKAFDCLIWALQKSCTTALGQKNSVRSDGFRLVYIES